MANQSWQDAVTLGIAGLGAALGIMNTWHTISQRRLRLRVQPVNVITLMRHDLAFCIEVTNLSAFAITIEEVGFLLGRSRPKRAQRLAVIQPVLRDGQPWPRRLEPREAVSVYLDPNDIGRPSRPIGKAYAKTACGEMVLGDSPALRQLRETLAAGQSGR